MKQSKRVLSFLLAFVMLATTLAFSTSAGAPLPTTVAAATYDETSKIILSTNQYSTLILDELDRMLTKEAIFLDLDEVTGGFLTGTLNLRTIDTTLDSLTGSMSPALNLIRQLVPDGLNVEYVVGVRRSNSGDNADTQVLSAILQILSDPNRTGTGKSNAELIGKIVVALLEGGDALETLLGGTLTSIVGGFLGDLDIVVMLKEMIWEMVSDDPMPDPAPELDDMIQSLLEGLADSDDLTISLGDTEIDLGSVISGINIKTDSMYQLIDKVLQPLYEDVLAGLLDDMLRTMLEDVAEGSEFEQYIDLNYQVPTWADLNIGANDSIFDKLNDIIGLFISRVITHPDIEWDMGGNSLLVNNIINVGKVLIIDFGDMIFPDVVFKSEAEINAMGEMEFVAYFARTLVNDLMYYVYVPEKVGTEEIDTLAEVLNVVLIEQAGDTIPEMYGAYVASYYGTPASLASVNTTLELLSDYLVKLTYFEVDTNVLTGYDRSSTSAAKATTAAAGTNTLRYADTFDQVIAKLVNWVVGNYGGVINPSLIVSGLVANPANAWQTLDNIIFGLIDSSWLGGNYGPGASEKGLRELIVDDLLGQILGTSGTIDISQALSIFSKNPTGGLNSPVAEILITLILDVLDLILGDTTGTVSTPAMRSGYKKLEDILSKTTLLGSLVTNLLTCLGAAAHRLIPTALPILADVLDLSRDAAYRAPEIGLPEVIPYQSSAAWYDFEVFNDSAGLPVMNYNPMKDKRSDPAYNYVLRNASVTYSKVADAGNTFHGTHSGLRVTLNNNPVSDYTLYPGDSATLRLHLPADVIDHVVTVALTYAVMIDGETEAISQLTTRLYSFVAEYKPGDKNRSLIWLEQIGTSQDYIEVWTVTDDAHKPDTVREGTIIGDYGDEDNNAPTKAEDGYANSLTYPQYRFFDQNVTMGQLAEALSVTVTRPMDLGTFNSDGSQATQPVNTEDSLVRLSPYYFLSDPDDPQGYYTYDTEWDPNYEGASWDFLNFFTIKDPRTDAVMAETTNDGGSSTLRPFQLKALENIDFGAFDLEAIFAEEIAAGDVDLDYLTIDDIANKPVTDFFDDGYYVTGVYFGGDGTAQGTTGSMVEPYDDQGPYGASELFAARMTFVIENDYGIGSLVRDAMRADVQRSAYVNSQAATDAYNAYMENLSKAAYIVLKLKSEGLMCGNAIQGFYDTLSQSIDNLAQYINPVSSTDELEEMLQKVYGLKDNAYVVEGETVYLNYWDPEYTYFGAADFIATGFEKARSAISMAENIIARSKEGVDTPSDMEINYCISLLNLTCDFFLDGPYDIASVQSNAHLTWQLLPTAAFQNAMEYQREWLENNDIPGIEGLTFAAVKTAFDAQGGYNATGDYVDVPVVGGDPIALKGDTVRALMRAYDNVLTVQDAYDYSNPSALDRVLILGQSPVSLEFLADKMPVENSAYGLPIEIFPAGGLVRVPQSRLTRARDELVYAYKHIVAVEGEPEPPEDLDWSALDTIFESVTTDDDVIGGDGATLAELAEDNDLADFFVAAYRDNFNALLDAAATLLTTKEDTVAPEDMAAKQAEIDEAAELLAKASKLMVAIVPTEDAYVYDGSGLQSQISINLIKYNEYANSAMLEGKSVKEYLDTSEYVLLDKADNLPYDGYIYGLDNRKPSLLVVSPSEVAPYKVINGTAEVTTNGSNRYTTGATVLVKDVDGAEFVKLKTVYFGDINGNGTTLEASELSDLKMTLMGTKFIGDFNKTPGYYGPQTMAMDVYASSSLDESDVAVFSTKGTRFVDQSLYAPFVSGDADETNMVVGGKAQAPQ